MTWHAQRGSTVLIGSEAKLFALAIEEICEELRFADLVEGCQLYYGPSLFNRMTATQQAASIEQVVGALFENTQTPFPLVAWSEATLAGILGVVRCSIAYEIDEGDSTETRDLIDRLTDSEVSPERQDWDSNGEWDLTFECYESQFLWDSDFDDDTLLDSSPEVSRRVGSMLGIGYEYHTTIPPDLKSDDDLQDCLKRIHATISKHYD
jgi:hypothetical protein